MSVGFEEFLLEFVFGQVRLIDFDPVVNFQVLETLVMLDS